MLERGGIRHSFLGIHVRLGGRASFAREPVSASHAFRAYYPSYELNCALIALAKDPKDFREMHSK